MATYILEDERQIKNLLCPECGNDVTELMYQHLEKITGIPAESFKEGKAANELEIKLQIAELTLTKAAITIDQSAISEKVLEKVDSILATKLAVEEQKKYQMQIDALNEKMNLERKQSQDIINLLKTQIAQEKIKMEEIQNKLIDVQSMAKYIPSLKGANTEQDIATRIRSIAPFDEPSLKQRYQGSTDILYKVMLDKKTFVGKICIESKDVKKWDDKFLQEAKEHAKKEGTENIIIATTTMPPDIINNNLDCFREDIWIVPMDLLEFAYCAYRQILITQYDLQKKFNTQLLTIEKETSVIEQLKTITTDDTFKKYSEIAKELLEEANSLDEESRTITNYIQNKIKRYQTIAKTVRKLVNEIIEHNNEIKEKISAVFIEE